MDYKNSKIYKIVNNENDNFYIGSTCSTLVKRMYGHRKKHSRCMSKHLGVDIKDCIIVLVENFECKDKDELLRKERYYIEKYREEGLNIVNKIIPGRTPKEYQENNKEKIKEKKKEYYEKNKECYKEKQKEHYQKNKEKIKEKEYYKKNKEKIKEQKKKKYLKNKELHKKRCKENYEKNKEVRQKEAIEYYQNNKEKIIKQKKEYREKNKEKITCECGAIIQKYGLTRHQETKGHINFFKSSN